MDAKDLRTEPALSERNNDSGKYSQSSGIALHCDRNKSYQDIGSNSLPKVEVQSARPCAVIGPDRVVPPTISNESYIKKGPTEPWPCMDNSYHTRRPPEYPHKLANFQNSTRNISPRQTFQENMQRIMVPPSYNSVKLCEDTNYTQLSERSNVLPKNIKINVPSEAKFCDVPYTVFPPNNEQKNVRNPDMCLPNVNPNLTRTAPHGWPGSVNVRPSRTYGAPDLYQYQDYSNCAGPRPVMSRPNRTGPEDPGYVYADPFYHQEGNIRFKPYPTPKERFPQQRYDYVSNYANSFHPQPTFQSHKYELQKPVPPHPYPPYPPIKYVDRVSEPTIDGYQRNQQGNYNISYRNQLIHPNFGPVLGSCPQNKVHSYPPDGHIKTIGPNKMPYENAKGYIEYENGRPKMYPQSEGYLVNEMGRMHPMKSQVIMPNYSSLNMHGMPPNPYYKKDSQQLKNYEYIQAHFRTMDPNINMHNPMARHPQIFSPNAISPTDSSVSNDTSHALGTPQEDCGYASQSSTASVRSIDSGMNRMPNDYIRKYYDSRFGPINRTSAMMSKSELNPTNGSKEKKNIDVRQFLQMWNEGDEETEENIPKGIIQAGSKTDGNYSKTHEVISQANQEQLYVLGLVNVSSEELGKYEHIQKVSKLPENIKGYNHIELLNQFEEAIESSNITNYKTSKKFQMAPKVTSLNKGTCAIPPRPLSPLDVEAKISQSVIHKEVGCNFEIKPCSPKMMNVEVATPVQNILLERVIEKVANPVMLKSPRLNEVDENIDCNIIKKDHRLNMNDEANRIPSCKMINTQFSNNNNIDTIKNSYSLQDLESNSGLCLASLPRLDNDIELNFPEVNQQFINANKRDSSCLTNSPRDLPTLEVLEQENQSKDKLKDLNLLTCETDNLKSPCVPESEKEFSKLSKYRKTRIHSTIPKDNIHAVRTDSVIIKNPDNVKNYDEHLVLSPNPVIKEVIDIQQAPINLTSQGNITENSNNIPILAEQNNRERDSAIDIAIDFRLKNITNDDDECMDENIDKKAESLSQNLSKTNNSILDQHISKPANTDTHQNDCSSHVKIDENVPNSEICSNTRTAKEISSVDTPIEEAFTNNEYISAAINEAKEEYVSPVSCVNDVNDDDSNPLLPIDFVTPPVELLPTTDGSSSDYLMDITMKNVANSDKSQNPSATAHVEELKTCNEHGPVNSDTYPRDTEITIMKGTIESDSKINASKDTKINRLLKVTEFSNTQQSDSNNIVLSKEQKETRDTLKLETTEENINSNFDLSSLSSNSSANNYHSETINEETHSNFDLSSTNSVIEQNSSDYLSETAKQKLFGNNCPNNMYDESNVSLEKSDQESNDATENIERDFFSNFNIPSPNHTLISKQDNPSETTVGESGSNFDMTDIAYRADTSSVTTEVITVSNLNSTSPKHSYKSDLKHLDTDSNVTDIASLKETYDRNNVELNSIEGRTEDLLTEEEADVKDTLGIDDTSCEGSLIENTDVNITTKCTIENVKEVHRDVRYLSYGSKEMYSQTIQNLIMFHEGNTFNKHSICGTLSELETGQVLDDFSSDNATQHNTDDTENSISPVDAKSPIEKPFEYEIFQNDCENIEDINNISKIDKLLNTDLMNHEESKSPKAFEADNNRDIDDTYTQCNVDRTPYSSASEIHEERDKQTDFNFEITDEDSHCIVNEANSEQLEKENKAEDEIPQQLENKIKHSNETLGQWDKSSQPYVDSPVQVKEDTSLKCYNELPKQRDKLDISNKQTFEDWEKQPSVNDEVVEQWEGPSNRNDEIGPQDDKQSNCSSELLSQCNIEPGCNNVLFEPNGQSEDWHKQSQVNKISRVICDRPTSGKSESLDKLDKHSKSEDIEIETSITAPSNDLTCSKVQSTEHFSLTKSRQPLKRSLSDSALNFYKSNESSQLQNEERVHFIWPFKRRKMNSVDNNVLAQNLCNIIQSNRRNSISSFYNEENVSFCILIDNSCVISEEENDNEENICYTEISEECLPRVQNDCIKDDGDAEIIPEMILTLEPLTQEENHCQYSESYALESEDSKLEESWVEDVACVETIFNDDIAEDIEISGPSSPKDEDIFSDNDESGIFSSTEHTDKVKYIYGDKMCNDDAQFVETLYNTPQMDVNKTLIQRETHIPGEYYDNDSLEKILSESNDQEQAPSYMPAHSEPENMSLKTKSTIENIDKTAEVTDTVILKIEDRNENKGHFNKSQDNTVHSCESSIDNVFTYKEEDENAGYITSSSPEVSSTTSEEKSSAILLKITNYKGSRISQINDNIRDNKSPRCKFTEDKGYAQSQSNFTTHRPLLTKAAQKYIPPLKESIRDLKVKLSLPQHSLIKLKQLKQSKDEPKVCKQSISVTKISMKPKPKFEDVLKSIDEIQFQMHKEKTKKSKKSIPKVVIKKNENGSHYASTSNKNEYNPDLTGRKWQPWVFIEKNHFIDKMAIKKKTKAVYSHRKRTYVLAEKFQKYKSVHAKFVISPPLSDCPSSGLKYTIRLKHNY
ncbi:unnamed protein product [Arctia plantaginis]|uniref:Uncharacterized protein n=1 Tax=Arctia plantaginis TaxID=874455 RepID=A0A8S1A5L7_ARCPL|nr:unnamed protein product [Arctia plantaginis]